MYLCDFLGLINQTVKNNNMHIKTTHVIDFQH
jgi:hypothetical protein